jgi:hypothetical protein
MRLRYWLAGLVGAMSLGLVTMVAQAAPGGNAVTDMKSTVTQGSPMQNVHYRDRYRDHGYYPRRHHRYHGYGPGFYYGYRPYGDW